MIQFELFIAEAGNQIAQMIHFINYEPFYKSVGNILENAVASQFETEGQYFQRGAPWMALAPSTVKQRTSQGFGGAHPILRRAGGDAGLLGSIHSSVEGNQIILAAAKSYAIYLQKGTRKMPARPFLPEPQFGLPPDVLESIERAFEKFMSKQVK